MSENTKKSIIYGGLISSAGVLFSKILGLVYVIPFNMIAGDTNVAYYGYAYNIYAYVLNVSVAGIPYAIATLVAKYYDVKDYRTTLLIKKLSLGLMIALGFISMCFVILTSGPLAGMILAEGSSPEEITITQNVMVIISFALFFVPVLSAYRGFYQGLKEMKLYAYSQVLEQLVRVFFLLGAGAIAVYLFHMDQIWAVYFAVFSTSVAAICALLHIKSVDRKAMKEMKQLVATQERISNNDKMVLLKEMIVIAIPYLLSAVIAYSQDMVNLLFFTKALESTGVNGALSNYIYGTVLGMHTKKIIAIPQILCVGFSASIIPYITTSLERRDFKMVNRHIKDTLESVLYILLPMSFCLFFFSKEVMFLLFGNPTIELTDTVNQAVIVFQQLDYEDYLMKFRVIDSIMGTIAPLFTSLLIACRLGKKPLFALLAGAIMKFVSLYPCVWLFGMNGATFSNLCSYLTIMLIDIYYLNTIFHIRWKSTLKKLFVMCLGVLGMTLIYWVLYALLGDLTRFGRIEMLPIVILEGIVVLLAYLMITGVFQLPQLIFKIDMNTIKRRFKR